MQDFLGKDFSKKHCILVIAFLLIIHKKNCEKIVYASIVHIAIMSCLGYVINISVKILNCIFTSKCLQCTIIFIQRYSDFYNACNRFKN